MPTKAACQKSAGTALPPLLPDTLPQRWWFPGVPVLSQMERRGLERSVEGLGLNLSLQELWPLPCWGSRCILILTGTITGGSPQTSKAESCIWTCTREKRVPCSNEQRKQARVLRAWGQGCYINAKMRGPVLPTTMSLMC